MGAIKQSSLNTSQDAASKRHSLGSSRMKDIQWTLKYCNLRTVSVIRAIAYANVKRIAKNWKIWMQGQGMEEGYRLTNHNTNATPQWQRFLANLNFLVWTIAIVYVLSVRSVLKEYIMYARTSFFINCIRVYDKQNTCHPWTPIVCTDYMTPTLVFSRMNFSLYIIMLC